jgi:hypothetical protein
MIGMRDKSWRRFGATLAGLALGMQLMLSSFGLMMTAAAAQPADAFGGHALCLAGGAVPPAGQTPAPPAHNHLAFCCLWHQLSGLQPVAAAVPVPVLAAYVGRGQPRLASFIPGPQRGPANARAPPNLA